MRSNNKVVSKSLAVLSLIAVAGMVSASGSVTGVEARRVGEGVEVLVRGTGLSAPKTQRIMNNTTFIASFDAALRSTGRKLNVNFSGVSTVQWSQFSTKPLVTRITIKHRPDDAPVVAKVAEGYVIRINLPKPAAPVDTVPSKPIIVLEEPKPVVNPNPIKTNQETRPNTNTSTTTGSRSTVEDPNTSPTPPPNTENNPLLPKVDPDKKNDSPRVVASASVNQPRRNEPTPSVRRISLDFADTDVVQVLKALATQADANIVTSPDVKGTISISLKNVTVEEALTVVTAIAGLRYQKLDRTIIVAPPDKITSIMHNASVGSPNITGQTEIRIVPIYCKQGSQVKAALYRVLPQDARTGRYEVALPSEQLMGGADAKDPKGTVDEYIMVIGNRQRLDEVERMVRSLDDQICSALGIDSPKTSQLVTETYFVRGAKASELVTALGMKEGKVGNVSVSATPDDSASRQTIVMTGRENEVGRLMKTLQELDGSEKANDVIEIYEVRFSDPRALRDEVMLQIPGIRASVPPAGVGATRVYVPATGKIKDSKSGGEDGGASSTTSTSAAQAAVEKSEGLKSGLALPFSGLEPNAVPMRLILRGDQDMMRKAVSFLAELDKQPRQLALEVRVMELRKEDATSAGIDWNLLTGGAVKFLRLENTAIDPKNRVGIGINGTDVNGDIVGTLDRIANNNNLIARPNMIAYDGRESELFIGDVIRYVQSVISSQNGPSVTIGEVRVGVNLSVLPRISTEGTATLDLRPTISFLREFRQFQISGFTAELPQTSERQSQQTVNIRSGDTIAIGGLITEEDVRASTGIPILMDLPILGNFFKSSRTRKDRRELVIFITSKVLTEPLGSGDSQLPMMSDTDKSGSTAKTKTGG